MRKTYSLEFKAKLIMEVFRGERLLHEIASENNVHLNMLTRWKTEAINNLHVLFENENAKMRKQAKQYEAQIEELYIQIGKLTAQYEWMKKIWNLTSAGKKKFSWLIYFNDSVFSVSTQADMLGLNRTSLYYKPRPFSDWDLQLNRLIDITYTKHPEFGYRRITAWLENYYDFHVEKNGIVQNAMGYRLFIPGSIPVKLILPIRCTHTFSVEYSPPGQTIYVALILPISLYKRAGFTSPLL